MITYYFVHRMKIMFQEAFADTPMLAAPIAHFPASIGAAARAAVDPPQLVIAPAVTYQQYRACAALVRRMYSWRGYQISAPPRFDDPNNVMLGIWSDGELVSTLTLSRDSGNGLLADNLYPDELAHLRKPGTTICEVTRLAVDVENEGVALLKSLFRAAYQYGRAVFGATDAVIEVNPRHVRYYRQELGFMPIGELRTCPRVGAPAVLMHRLVANLHI